MRILGLITARGGSKGVLRKNVKLLHELPLIGYSIKSALETDLLDDVIVSTEDAEIAKISKQLGAKVPFMRPQELATDNSPTIDTIVYTVKKLQSLGEEYDAICLLQPTTPFRNQKDLVKAIEKFKTTRADSLISVRKVPHQYNPHWVFERTESTPYLTIATGEDRIISRRQELPEAFYRDGSIYLTKVSVIIDEKSLFGKKITYYETKYSPDINIDTLEDWKKAEAYINQNNLS